MRSGAAVEFPPFRLDLVNQQLWRGGVLLPLRPKPFAVLAYLAMQAGRLVPRAELVKAVWPDTHIGAAVLRGYIRDLRLALGDDPQAPRFIETLAHRGYRFVAAVSGSAASPADDQQPQPAGELRNPTLVGREAELGLLHRCLMRAMRGSRQVVFLTGEPGIGKTTLVDAFLANPASGTKVRVARGQCVEHFGSGEGYLPLLEALAQLCRDPGGDELIALLTRHAPTWLVQMPALISDNELAAVQRRVQGASRERMLRELAEALEVLTAATPLILVIEDLQWSDFSTLDLLSLTAQRRGLARLLLLGTYRPADVILSRHPVRALKQELQVRGQCEELALGCLNVSEVDQYLVARFPAQKSSTALGQFIHHATEGNPLFMVNVVDYWLSQGVLAETDGQWCLTADVADARVGLPESLRQMIEKQLERFTPVEQRVLEVASVVGSTFSAALVAPALEVSTEEVEEVCRRLAQRALFLRESVPTQWPDGTISANYSFLHAFYQQVQYERLVVGRRVRLHRQLGQWLEAAYGGQTDEIAAELAVHFERGHAYEQAVQYAWKAADNAGRRHAPHEAAALLSKALELLEALPDTPERDQQELALRVGLGVPLLMIKGYGAREVKETFTRARELCQQLTESPQLLPALAGLFRFYFVRAEFQTARELAEQVLRLAQETSEPVILLLAHSLLGVSLLNLAGFTAAHDHLVQGIQLYDPERHRFLAVLYGDDPGVVCLSFASVALWFLGYPDQARQRCEEAVALARELSHPYSLAFALSFAGEIHVRRREPVEGQKYLDALRVLATEQGFSFFLAQGTFLHGWARAEQQSREEGTAQMRRALADYQATGAEMGRPSHLVLLAEALAKSGHLDEALAEWENARVAIDKTGERTYEAELYRLKGELVLAASSQGQPSIVRRPKNKSRSAAIAKRSETIESQAERHFHQAIEVARNQQNRALELRAVTSLSRMLLQQGQRGPARKMLAEIYNWFTEGFETADLKDAKALLDELGTV
jgi:predicted ATPase/DNA-binding winged helix-turn-helix (wHTH) protein